MNYAVFIMILTHRISTAFSPAPRLGLKYFSLLGFPKRLPTNPELKPQELQSEEIKRVQDAISFLDSSPDPFHCVKTVSEILLKSNFKFIRESDVWSGKLQKGGKYFFTRNRSSIVAFTIGEKYKVGNGFKIIGAHTDSPNLKLKPRSKRSASGLAQVNVECYGGGLWYTWFDRELSIAGRVITRKPSLNSEPINDNISSDSSFQHNLVRIKNPVLRVPSLCIHLRTPEEREAFKINKEDHLIPILCTEIDKSLSSKSLPNDSKGNNQSPNSTSTSTGEPGEPDLWAQEQQPELLRLLANELNCSVSDIVDFELSLYDTQGASISGSRGEFLCGSRIDNLASCFVAVEALVDHSNSKEFSEDADVSVVALFDHEEVGSGSAAGAGSPLIRDAVSRITDALTPRDQRDGETAQAVITKSFILSVDMAHAVHPNYASKHEKAHSPQMNAGIVIKTNSNQRYASNGVTSFIVRELGRMAGVPVQEFAVRNDCPCGSTIGPILSQNTGIRAVDLGMPQLSMHSIREMMGCSDLTFAHRLFVKFLQNFRKIDDALAVDDDLSL